VTSSRATRRVALRALSCVLLPLVLGAASGCKRHTGDGDAGADAAAFDLDGGDDAGDEGAADAVDGGDAELRLPPESDELTARGKHLLEAIVQGNPDLAGDMLLARDAYQKLREEADPSRSYDRKVTPGFARSVGLLHKRTKGIEGAQFVSFEIGGSITQAPPPSTTGRRHEWKRPVWRAHHAKLVFTVNGKTERFDVSELVAWRGSWYVLRLR
jgi:hypothetical protein